MKLHQALCFLPFFLAGLNVCETTSTSTSISTDSTISPTATTISTTSSTITISASTLVTIPIVSTTSAAVITSATVTTSTVPTTSTNTAGGSNIPIDTSIGSNPTLSTAKQTTGATTQPVKFVCISHTCFWKGCLTNATNSNTTTGNCTESFCTMVQYFNEASYNITAGCESSCNEKDERIGNFTVRTRCCQKNQCNKDDLGIVSLPVTGGNGGSAISPTLFWILSIMLFIVVFKTL